MVAGWTATWCSPTPKASRLHARIRKLASGEWQIEDAGSRNGTRVNGVPVRERPLAPVDRVSIGSTEFRVADGHLYSQPELVTAHATPATPRAPSAFAEEILGRSSAMLRVFGSLHKAFASPAPILLTGESGTGKELVARSLHQNGTNRDGPWVVVHCAALAPGTLESELFGHEKGAFTGADARRIGRFEWANGGTLFLDEVGEIPAPVQVKLLRVLETGEFQRVGGNELLRSRFRLIAATNRDIEKAVASGEVREDLFFRLRVIQIHLPPLRDRREDIRLLAEHFIGRFCRERGLPPKRFTAVALRRLEEYPWPGNVRELKNRLERLVLFHEGTEVGPEQLEDLGKGTAATEAAGSLAAKRRELERREILQALEKTRWNKKRAAALLGMNRKTLYNRLAEFGIRRDSP